MPAQYDPDAFTKRRGVYTATARYFFGTMYGIYHRLEVTGRDKLPPSPFIVVANHLSNNDPPLMSAVVGRPTAFLAKEELYDFPFVRQFCLYFGAISVDRDRPGPSTFKAVKKAFEAGWNLGLFIEGTRSKTPGMLGTPHEGPAYFARANKALIVPVGLVGTDKPWGKAYAHIGDPMEPKKDLQECTWDIMRALSELSGLSLPPTKEVDAKL